MTLNTGNIQYLIDIGYSKKDIEQIKRAAQKTTFDLNGKHISAERAFTLIHDSKKFWACMSRSAFHWSSSTMTELGEVGFDSRKFFKE